MQDGKGFERWLAKRAAKRATAPEDNDFYEAYVNAATGQAAETTAGVAQHLEPGVKVPETLSD
ncbi:MAG: hypothetical protein CYG60_15535, partial [Actinobacteria bacterium]